MSRAREDGAGEEGEGVVVPCAEHHSINLVLCCSILKDHGRTPEFLNVGLQNQKASKDADRKLVVD